METKQLESTTGFVVYDLPGADNYVGQARLGAKLAPANAAMLVRHQTYVFAVLEQRRSGATLGLKVDPDQTADAVAAAATELAEEFSSQRLSVSPGLRLDHDALAPILAHDQRNSLLGDDRDGIRFEDELVGVGAVAAASGTRGSLDGARVSIEGFGTVGLAIAREAAAQGAVIHRISTSKGCVTGEFDVTTLTDAFMSAGAGCVEQLGKVGKPWEIYKGDVDVVFVGSGPGAMSGQGASMVGTTPVVAVGPAAISSKAMAVLRQQGAPTAADFVAGVGPALAWWSDSTSHDDLRSSTSSTVAALVEETAGHADGGFMAACYKAEAFMTTWQDTLPFGRPLG